MPTKPPPTTAPGRPDDSVGEPHPTTWARLEAIIHADPGQRGLCGLRPGGAWLDHGALAAAAASLAAGGTSVGIITGFCAQADGRVTAETDGPPGALFLARALSALGCEVTLISDCYGRPLLELGCDVFRLPRTLVHEMPLRTDNRSAANVERWCVDLFNAGAARRWSHLVAIERPGPSHTLESLERQARNGRPPTASFLAEVAPEARDCCHNMRGASIDRYTAPTHRIFEWLADRGLPIVTIGIGDGGNELGLGSFPWEVIRDALDGAAAGRIVCRIAAQHTLLAGVSDWAAYALALAVCRLRRSDALAAEWTGAGQRALIESLVRDAGAVDGRTGAATPTVDGLSLDDYLAPLAELRRALGYAP